MSILHAARRRDSHAFSMIEIVLVLGLMALIISTAVMTYGDYQASAIESAARQDLDTIRRAVEAWQSERHRPYPHTGLPETLQSGRAQIEDPWGRPYRVDPTRHVVYSCGPDSTDDHGEGDDLRVEYEPFLYDKLRAPLEFRLASSDASSVTVAWTPLKVSDDPVATYHIRRRTAKSVAWDWEKDVPASKSEYTDRDVRPGETYLFQMQAISAAGRRGPYSKVIGFRIPEAGALALRVIPSSGTAAAGCPVTFRVEAETSGAALTRFVVDRAPQPLDGSNRAFVEFSRVFVRDAMIRIDAADTANQRRSLVVQVRVITRVGDPGQGEATYEVQ